MVYPERKERRPSGSSRSFRKGLSGSMGRNRWAIILAGGDGTRLLSLTRAIAGDDRPKQFCSILGDETLLDQTRRRVSLAVMRAQTMFSLRESHKAFYEELVAMDELPAGIRHVRRFWEKPSAKAAKAFMDRGFLWNSFVMVGRVEAFLNSIRRAVPKLYASFEAVKPTFGTERESKAVRNLYARIDPSNFSHDVLSIRANDLCVMPVKNVGWSDWGDPSRVLSTLARIGLQVECARTSA